ncbi:hypothetical protein CONPUDRAFT_152241 [Coniophora puteana RWD-64-598 SS2]|uniref:N-acetyltransferase domain-containing protein n=1 Tax=Coniophora puteana (strain RWD-64-598) TaxID=741705 RepID=A0A5M3MWX2_CONPW|nr:uncharacterized protein CONPUDRAFT_152241 [Coniophora puteana RWD-64-598 SS2]EIW83205.1 hypothetical protein CONPUDRAFT_152241 [Coniophora puteana RWD-64-598 SS2]
MTSPVALHEVDLTSETTLSAVIELLRPHAPYSLAALGGILNSRDRTVALPLSPPTVQMWLTAPLSDLHPGTPTLFSAVVFLPVSHQFRFVCSAESSPSSEAVAPSAEEQAHVLAAFHALLQLAAAHRPTYDADLMPTKVLHAPEAKGTDAPPMVLVGCVNARWSACLQPLAESQNPSVRQIRPALAPEARSGVTGQDHPAALPLSESWTISKIEERDVDAVRSTSHIPRSREYLLSRSATSVCIRDEAASPPGRAISWGLLHADGSIGALYVDPDYRRRGLAKFVVKELVRKLDVRFPDSPLASGDEGGGALGWNWTEADVWNEESQKLLLSLEGWRYGWMVHWTYIRGDRAMKKLS